MMKMGLGLVVVAVVVLMFFGFGEAGLSSYRATGPKRVLGIWLWGED